MSILQKISLGYFFVLLGAAALNYIPGITDDQGRSFGVFALDPFDDGLHLASAIWALVATLLGHRGARMFLTLFGALYLGDGLLGLATGSGYLDFGIFLSGTLDLPFTFKIMANTPHILLGGFALWSGLRLGGG